MTAGARGFSKLARVERSGVTNRGSAPSIRMLAANSKGAQMSESTIGDDVCVALDDVYAPVEDCGMRPA